MARIPHATRPFDLSPLALFPRSLVTSMKALGEIAANLPWLAPDVENLVVLARNPSPSQWEIIRHDPGAVLLLARVSTFHPFPQTSESWPQLLAQPDVLEIALTCFQQGQVGFVDWNRPGPKEVHCYCLELARLANALAQKVPGCDPDRAWITGLLAPLGWLALCAIQSEQVSGFLRQASSIPDSNWQKANWGLDHAALVRRLCRCWQVPSWLASIVGQLALPVEMASNLGAEPVLFQLIQLTLALCQEKEIGLALPVGGKIADLLVALNLNDQEVSQIVQDVRSPIPAVSQGYKTPADFPLLEDLLRLTLEHRRQHGPAGVEDLQDQIDQLQRVLQGQWDRHQEKLHEGKMASLAEFAAGAGHEINNPLAVISGQAQYILKQLQEAQSLVPEEPALASYVEGLEQKINHALHKVIGQSQRIHQMLTGLMQFARPSKPRPQMVCVQNLLGEVSAALQDLAQSRKVRLVGLEVPENWRLHVDPGQVRLALENLLRNAIEAAPQEGWAGLRAEKITPDTLEVIVEDNSPGPATNVQEHMFDPFYSGRTAGRGRGLGLSTAWRLAQQQGGTVRYAGHAQGITRFVLSLPGLETTEKPTPKNTNGQAKESNGHHGCLVSLPKS